MTDRVTKFSSRVTSSTASKEHMVENHRGRTIGVAPRLKGKSTKKVSEDNYIYFVHA